MTKSKAIAKANRLSDRTGQEFFVVCDPDVVGSVPGSTYQVASEFDMETFYLGEEIVYSTYTGV